MKSYSWILILVLFLSGFSSCHSDAERYKDILREGSWYVYDIDYSYKLYDDFETPELFDFFHYLLDERNLLFLPGDELMFSKRRIDVNCPDGDRFGYDYYYSGDYIRIGRDGDYMDLFPQGDMNALTLTLDRIGLENLLSYWDKSCRGCMKYEVSASSCLFGMRLFFSEVTHIAQFQGTRKQKGNC